VLPFNERESAAAAERVPAEASPSSNSIAGPVGPAISLFSRP
jgi:hypothetical protein